MLIDAVSMSDRGMKLFLVQVDTETSKHLSEQLWILLSRFESNSLDVTSDVELLASARAPLRRRSAISRAGSKGIEITSCAAAGYEAKDNLHRGFV